MPGDVVVDLGSGSGVLGLLACEAGAAKVYCIDHSPMLEVAREVVLASPYADRFEMVAGSSNEVTLPEHGQVVICDQMAPFGVGAHLWLSLFDARERHLVPGARLVPRRLSIHCALVASGRVAERLAFWDGEPSGFAFQSVRAHEANRIHWLRTPASELLGPAKRYVSIDLTQEAPRRLSGSVTLEASRPGKANGIAAWFVAELAEGVTITNAPAPDRIDRDNVVLPLAEPIALEPGERVDLRMHLDPDDMSASWRTLVTRPDGAIHRQQQSTLLGAITKDAVRRADPTFTPELHPRGRAKLTALGLCDGTRTVEAIVEATFAEHRALFRTRERAARFVASLIRGSSA